MDEVIDVRQSSASDRRPLPGAIGLKLGVTHLDRLARSPVRSDPAVMGGTLVFRGSRVPAQTLFDYLDDGYTLEQILEMFPSIDPDDAMEFLRLARGESHADRP